MQKQLKRIQKKGLCPVLIITKVYRDVKEVIEDPNGSFGGKVIEIDHEIYSPDGWNLYAKEFGELCFPDRFLLGNDELTKAYLKMRILSELRLSF